MIAQHSSQSNEHYTPSEVVDAARRLMGGIDLDPASCLEANSRVRASHILTQEQDGLSFGWDWHGQPQRVFLNPPGGIIVKETDLANTVPPRWRPARKNANGRFCEHGESSMLIWWAKLVREWEAGRVSQAVFVGFTLEILRISQQCPTPVQAFPRCYPRDRLRFGGPSPTHANVIVWLPPKFQHEQYPDMNICSKLMAEEFGALGYCEGGS